MPKQIEEPKKGFCFFSLKTEMYVLITKLT